MLAVWRPRRVRTLLAPAILVAVAVLVVSPWTIRNARELHAFVPVSTQFGTALAGTYNTEAMNDRFNPGSWRSLRRVPEYAPLSANFRTTNEAVREQRLRKAAEQFIEDHPLYLGTVLYWNTRRMLDLASLDWSRHTARTISVDQRAADRAVYCFWIFLALAIIGAWRRPPAPWWLWLVPLLMYLSVVFTAAETPRYRAPIDPFLILLAAYALDGVRLARPWRRAGSSPSRGRNGPSSS